jgi:hypothetical protein
MKYFILVVSIFSCIVHVKEFCRQISRFCPTISPLLLNNNNNNETKITKRKQERERESTRRKRNNNNGQAKGTTLLA